METSNNKKRKVVPAKKQQTTAPKRRTPGAKAVQKPQKAPHAMPRKNEPVQEPVRVTPEVVYLAPKPFSRNRFILHMATVIAVVFALMLGLSLFFKVENIRVSGCNQYTAYQVQQASGLNQGDQLLTFNRAKAAGKVINALPYVKTVRIGISLPDTVYIEIQESLVTYAAADSSGIWWIMDANGKILESISGGYENHTLIYGITLDAPKPGSSATAVQPAQKETDADGNPIPITVTAAQKLDAAITIAKYLEANGIIGQVDSMDVGNLYDVQLKYDGKYQVFLGQASGLDEKIASLKTVADSFAQTRPYEIGELDISDPSHITFQSLAGS